jgi:PHD/YefM family antitoxin component YafN of YafNO toxin-antitoxin module
MKDIATRRSGVATLLIATALAALSFGATPQGQQTESTDRAQEVPAFGGKYQDLTPRQKSLIDDLYRRYTAVIGEALDPRKAYDAEPLSWRTTFEAVTHATAKSSLTDTSGASLGAAIDLIEYVEAVHGKIRGARGDHQFRMYVRLKPGALETLEKSREFTRGHDNTHYHIGYPLNYREDGTPSVQFSMVPDGTRADIDVDYRSSKFPKALIDGHLTAGNSDVRAGNNLDVHNRRWSGFVGWWRNLLGLPFFGETYKGERAPADDIPVYPRAGKEKIEEAIHDFLSAWLIEGQSNQAAAYLSDRAYACMALELEDPESFDYGTAPLEMMARLDAVTQSLGEVETLGDAVTGVRLILPDFDVLHQKYHGQFVIYGVPEHVAALYECRNTIRVGDRPEHRPTEVRGFKYFATTFSLNDPGNSGRVETLGMLWTKEEGYWKVVSYEVEPSRYDASATMPNVGPASEMPELPREAGDPELIAATKDFFGSWFLKKNYSEALEHVSRRCYLCTDLDTTDTSQATPESRLRRLREGFQQVGEYVGPASRLEDVMEGVEPAHVDARVVTHQNEDAYSLMSVSDWLGDELDCKRRVDGIFSAPDERAQRFGKYYLSAFRIKTVAGETTPFILAWAKEDDEWRIVSYKLELP